MADPEEESEIPAEGEEVNPLEALNIDPAGKGGEVRLTPEIKRIKPVKPAGRFLGGFRGKTRPTTAAKTVDELAAAPVGEFLAQMSGEATTADAPDPPVPIAGPPPEPKVPAKPAEPESTEYEILGPHAPQKDEAPAKQVQGEHSKKVVEAKTSPFTAAAEAAAKREMRFWRDTAKEWAEKNLKNGTELTKEELTSLTRAMHDAYVDRHKIKGPPSGLGS